MAEMPDGGLLACYASDNGIDYNRLLVIRTDPNGHTLTNQISGQVYIDENNDCQFEPGEKGLNLITITAQSEGRTYSTTTSSTGRFLLRTIGANPVISVSYPGNYMTPCAFQDTLPMAANSDSVWLPLGFHELVHCPELKVSVGSTLFRKCVNNTMYVQYHNFGTATATNASVTVTMAPELIYQSADAPLLNQNGQEYSFNIGTIEVGEVGGFHINFKVDCNAELGKLLCVESQIFPNTLCLPTVKDLTFNHFCLPVISAYDPNDKTALIKGVPETSRILPDTDLEYLIRFQNTGNDTAFNIVVVDTLSDKLNPSTVIPGASSHPYSFEIRDGRVLRFVFKNILLPDSTSDEPASHGYVKFYVHQTPGNLIGSTLSNTASIYFDQNAPVLTNESILIIANVVHTQHPPVEQINTWPVPAHDRVAFLLPAGFSTIQSWKLFDQMGQVLRIGALESSNFTIPRNGLPAGIYFCQMTLENGSTAMGRVVFD